MANNSPHVYFAQNSLLASTEVFLKNVEINDEDKQLLERILWDKALHFENNGLSRERFTLVQHGWQQTWLAVRLLQGLCDSDTLASARTEALFTSLLQSLDRLTPDCCKELKDVFNKVLLSNLISRERKLPLLKTSTEEALLRSLIKSPGETHLLLELVCCEHEAFTDICKSLKDLYYTALDHCLNSLPNCDFSEKKKLVNLLYVLLALVSPVDRHESENIGHRLYCLSQGGHLDFYTLLTVTGCSPIYKHLTDFENKRLFRHISCSTTDNIAVLDSIFSVITAGGKLSLDELCLRVFTTRNHWVEELVRLGCRYVSAEDQQKLEVLKTLPALWPAIAVTLWKQLLFRSDILDFVTPVIDTCQRFYPSLFSHLQQTLSRLTVLMDWLRRESDSCLPDVNAMLSLIRNHSLLYVLQATTHFVRLDHQKLSQLLLQVEGPESWNFRMFEGFKILFSVFELVVKAVDIFNEYEKEDCDKELIWNKYREEIGLQFLQLDQRINKIEPLDFRLELLEDIFVLLFLRSEDFCEDKFVDEWSPDENEDILQPGRCDMEDIATKSASLPSPLHGSSSSYLRSMSSSSYPSSSQRKHSSQSRQNIKTSSSKLSNGFVCYPWLVRDVLTCITRSLDYSQTTCDIVDCDRLNRLKESVEDACWRLDLVYDSCSVSVEDWVFNVDTPTSPTPTHKKRLKRSDSESCSGRKVSSSTTSIGSKSNSKLFSTSSCLINLMLSSPVSLLSYFIAKDDIDRASSAVQKFEMKDSPADIEVNYIKEFSNLSKSIAEVPYESENYSQTTNIASTLQTISHSTSIGVLGVSLTKLVEIFFARTRLPEEVGGSRGVVMLDLALSHAPTIQHSLCLIDLAFNYFNSSSSFPGSSSLKIFALSLRNVLQEVDGCKSLEEVLLDPAVPLRAPHLIKDLTLYWSSLKQCISAFQTVLHSGDDNLVDAAYLKLTSCVVTGQGLVKNYQDETKQHFLNQLRSYLCTLWKAVSYYYPQGTKYCVLQHDLDNLIGDLVFCEGKDPFDVEAALQPLSINMVYQVVANCTPTLTIESPKLKPSKIILNAGKLSEPDSEPFPPQEVSTVLRELLSCIEVAGPDGLHTLANDSAVQQVLASTSRLRQLDWHQLPAGDELYTFLVNLYNLIWLHAIITLELTEQYGLLSASACLRELSASCVGYQLADNCIVTLTQIRNTLIPYPASLVSSNLSSFPPLSSIPTDPRLLFLLASPYKLGPAVQDLSSRNLDQEVDRRMAAYVESTVQVTAVCVTVPVIIYHYLECTALTQGPESEVSIDDDVSNSSKDNVIDFLRDMLKRNDLEGKDISVDKDIALKISKDFSDRKVLREHSSGENMDESWNSREMRPEVLKYLATRNPLLGSVVERINLIESGVESGKSAMCTLPLERELMSIEANRLATLYDDNVMLAVLESMVDREKLWAWFDSAVQRHDWAACLDMISYIPEKQVKADPRFLLFGDYILEQLSSSADGWLHCQNISDPEKMCELTLANMDRWPQVGCITLFNILLSQDTLSLPRSSLAQARQLRSSFQTASHVASACKLSSTDDAWEVVEELIKCEKVSLALKWYLQRELANALHNSNTLLLTEQLVLELLERGQETSALELLQLLPCDQVVQLTGQLVLELLERGQETSALELLQLLPCDQAVQVCENIALRAQSVSSLQQITLFLQVQSVTPAQALRYTCLDIGVHMLNYIPWQEQDLYRHLVSQPELLVEQLLMCTRVSTLELVLQGLWERISTLPLSAPLSPPSLDAMLRRYAAKAVDMQVCVKALAARRQPTPTTPSKFTPPVVPPTKEEWVGNDEVTQCMCCESSVFSMFNRRHHCRRCGRVVCGVCSLNRLKVSGYGNVKVRICSDCYEYVLPKTSSMDVEGGPRSMRVESRCSEPEWWLTKDLVYNATVREEFTYTHAPSISLCLSILKLHSEHSSLLRFLFTTIENMLQLLRPISPGTVNPEVDYSLLVTMIRSLLEFAKLSCSQHGSHSDWATVDGLFAEVDLLGLLVTSPQTCVLLPSDPLRGHSALGSLRENLLKSELWTLALEVSTKAGLDYNSVWVAWGKACLKAGAWTDARDKFAHCNLLKRDTQLLADILQILQDDPLLKDLRSRLSRLKSLSSGQDILQASPRLEPRVYEECLYYLRTFGTSASSLAFYVSQNDISSAVCMLLECVIEVQVYLDHLFLPLLRSASITQLYTCMSEIDKSLLVFKEYLRASCAYCERHKLFHVLYQAQVWMNDNVRAAMTCIHFYKHNARHYQDLSANKLHLEKALSHLQLALTQNKGPASPLAMQLRDEDLLCYINTTTLQLEVTMFVDPKTPALTLFGDRSQRSSLASAVITSSSNMEQGLNLATRVVEDWEAEKAEVLREAAAELGRAGRGGEVEKLAALQQSDVEICNQLLFAALKNRSPQLDIKPLIELISGAPSKISAFIDCGLLLSAYLLAVKYKRLTDIQRILDAAVLLDQPRIIDLCQKRLHAHDQTNQE